MAHVVKGTKLIINGRECTLCLPTPSDTLPPLPKSVRFTGTAKLIGDLSQLDDLFRLPPGTAVIHGFNFNEPSVLGLTEGDVVSYMQGRKI